MPIQPAISTIATTNSMTASLFVRLHTYLNLLLWRNIHFAFSSFGLCWHFNTEPTQATVGIATCSKVFVLFRSQWHRHHRKGSECTYRQDRQDMQPYLQYNDQAIYTTTLTIQWKYDAVTLYAALGTLMILFLVGYFDIRYRQFRIIVEQQQQNWSSYERDNR